MISKVVLAKLSPTMEEGTVVKWHKQEGETVKVGDILAEIETDKANMEMEALAAGVLRRILIPAGASAPVGATIGVIAEAGEDVEPLIAELAQPAPPAEKPAAPAPDRGAAPPPAAVGPAPSPAPAPGGGVRIKASPLARAMAAAHQIPLASVPGSGPGGRIIKRDLDARIAAPSPASVPSSAPAPAPGIQPGSEVPLTSMRRVIARRLFESYSAAPHFFATVEVDMDPAVALRQQLNAARTAKATYNDLVVKACARGLAAFPLVNARWAEDRIQTLRPIDIGVAVALPDGLITPVVRGADRKGLFAIAAEVKELARRARERRLRPEEYTGSTFTVSNLGSFGVTQFTAIINPPESAILAVGAVRRVPVVDGDAIRPGHRMSITMSSDHRVIDGALAAQFLDHVRRLLEAPVALLIE